tara:strand:+ start:669 stop:1436 length:768 start_codon:yes stop_codon:yes gene_type:complete
MHDTSFSVTGDGPVVVLVHGMGLNLDMWQGQLAPLARKFKMLRYDLLGHGRSQAHPGPYEMVDFVDQLERLLDHLSIERCRLVGFSLGGLIVQAFTIACPTRVCRLAVLNAGYDRSDKDRAGMIERLRIARQDGHGTTVEMALERWFTEKFATDHPEIIDQVRHWMHSNDRNIYPEIYRVLAFGDQALASEIPKIRCPTLVMTCSDDVGSPPDMARRMAQAIPGAELAIVPELRHMGLMEAPSAINEILISFLAA